MKAYTRATISFVIATSCATTAISQTRCEMPLRFMQVDRDAPGNRTAVYGTNDALFFREKLQVNTDGTPKSYAVDDVFGRTRALNNMCNAMFNYCRELDKDGKKQRARDVAVAAAAGWPKPLFDRTRIAPNVIVMRGGKPCPTIDNYLLSATTLVDPSVRDVCNPARYVDALRVPALVLPLASMGFHAAGARIGDLVVAIAPNGEPVFGVVGDSGPKDALGEASIAMNGALNRVGRDPINYQDVLQHWVVTKAGLLIFPGSRDAANPYLTNSRIEAAGRARLASWGGIERLRSCLTSPG